MLKNNKMILAIITFIVLLLCIAAMIYSLVRNTVSNESSLVAQPLSHHQYENAEATLLQLLEDKDPKASLDYLRNAIRNNTALARECHPLLHHLGHSAYKKYKDFNKTVSYQDGLCNSGYTHGAVEAHLSASTDIHETLKTTCPSPDQKMTFQQWQCFHGMGHGVMYFTGKDLAQSITLCESLPTQSTRSSCVNGAFMERFIIVSHTGSHSSGDSHINTSLCEQQQEKYKSDCYFYAPTAYLERHINDYIGAFKNCEAVQSEYVATCIYGVGGQTAKENITRPEVARDICKKVSNKYRNSCIAGAVGLLINHNASTAPVAPLCTTTFAQYKTICSEQVVSWNKEFAL